MARGDGELGCGLWFAVFVFGGLWGGSYYAGSSGHAFLGRDCPLGADLVGNAPPDGVEQWCQEDTDNGTKRRHGRARQWYLNGQIKMEARFVHGVPQRDETRCWSINGVDLNQERCANIVSRSAAEPTTLHIVRAGETLLGIAQLYDRTTWEILRASGLSGADYRDGLRAGQPLEIPKIKRTLEPQR